MAQIILRLHNMQIKRDYSRACKLLNTTQSAALYRCVISTIRRARQEFPSGFGLLDDYQLLCLEALEERHNELDQIAKYTRLSKDHIATLLADLVDQGLVIETPRPRSEANKGASTMVYSIGRKVLPKRLS